MPPQKMAKTFMERYGFSDPDLKNLHHDQVLHRLVREPEEASRLLAAVAGVDPALYLADDIDVRLEVPLLDRAFTLGFVDAVVKGGDLWLRCDECRHWYQEMRRLELWVKAADERYRVHEEAIVLLLEDGHGEDENEIRGRAVRFVEGNRSNLGHVRLNRPCHHDTNCRVESWPLVVEVKTMVPTSGEVLRQMNFYREHAYHALDLHSANFAVYFSRGTCSYADVLLDQGVYCFHAPPPEGDNGKSDEDDHDPMFD